MDGWGGGMRSEGGEPLGPRRVARPRRAAFPRHVEVGADKNALARRETGGGWRADGKREEKGGRSVPRERGL